MEQHISNARITVNGKELPVEVTYNMPDPECTLIDLNAALRGLWTTTITCTGSIGHQEPTGPIVEGSVEPYE